MAAIPPINGMTVSNHSLSTTLTFFNWTVSPPQKSDADNHLISFFKAIKEMGESEAAAFDPSLHMEAINSLSKALQKGCSIVRYPQHHSVICAMAIIASEDPSNFKAAAD